MIHFTSPNVPSKVRRAKKSLLHLLTELRNISNIDYRLYFDSENVILADVTNNKILWINDATFSIAILEARLRSHIKYFRYEKIQDKSEINYIDYINTIQKFRAYYVR